MFNNPKKRKEANITLPDSPISATVQSFDLLPMVRHRLESMSLEARRECQEIVCYLLPMLKADFMVNFELIQSQYFLVKSILKSLGFWT
jgi:hypothetical protein